MQFTLILLGVCCLNKVLKTVPAETRDGWGYKKLEHWPPMTYRNHSSISSENNKTFRDLLETENTSKHNVELQPWIPFCAGKCTFCYFPVNCDKQNMGLYHEALKKALSFYAESPYVKSSTFSEFYIGWGSPSILSKDQITEISTFAEKNSSSIPTLRLSLLHAQIILQKRKSNYLLQMQ